MTQPFWSARWGKDKICPITYSRLRPGRSRDGIPYTIELQCTHRFCRKALLNWVLTNDQPTCPLCRQCITTLPNR